MATCVNGRASGGTVILYRGAWVLCVRFLFCWQVAHPFTYCLTHCHAPGQWKRCNTFWVVSSLPGWPDSPSWYVCIILRLSSSAGGTSILPSSVVHRVVPSVCHPSCSLTHPEYFPYSCARRYSSESSLPVSASFRNTSGGKRVTCLSLCCRSSSLGRDRALARVLFFP